MWACRIKILKLYVLVVRLFSLVTKNETVNYIIKMYFNALFWS